MCRPCLAGTEDVPGLVSAAGNHQLADDVLLAVYGFGALDSRDFLQRLEHLLPRGKSGLNTARDGRPHVRGMGKVMGLRRHGKTWPGGGDQRHPE